MTTNKRRGWLLLALCVLGIPLLALAGLWWASHTIQNALVGPNHTSQLTNPPPFLSDSLAVEKAQEALTLDGYDPTLWSPREDRRSTAPDGTPDVYLARNGINPNRGYVVFEPKKGEPPAPHPSVLIELSGNQVTCQVCLPK